MEALNAFCSSCPPSRESFFFYSSAEASEFFQEARLYFSHSRALLGTAAEASPKTCICMFTWGLLFNRFCLCVIWSAFTFHFQSHALQFCAEETLETVAVLVKACPTHLRMSFTQHSNTVWLPRNPLWKPDYSTLHNVSVGIKSVQVLFAYRSRLLTVINDDEVYFEKRVWLVGLR